jgi:outer membrane receptor protein involved in Fe transport
MKNLSLFVLLLLSTFGVYAQQHSNSPKSTIPTCQIKGQFIDSLTKETEPYATIRIDKSGTTNQKAVKLAVTDKDGNVKIEIPKVSGNYQITLSSVGKMTVVKSFSIKDDTHVIDFGKIFTKENTHNLKGVEVVAQKPLVKMDIDKISYDIESDPDSKTNTVMEMLRKVPLVTVDGEDNIKVNGSSSFKIYVNGKPNTMMSRNPKDVLKSMPANSIKKIEVITSPGAKYDAEGTAGILNIVTTSTGMEGYTATFSANVGNRQAGVGAYATTKLGKFTLSTNYGYTYNSQPKSYQNSHRENYTSDVQKFLDSHMDQINHGHFQYGTVEASYEIDSLRLLSTSFTLMRYGYFIKNNTLSSMWNTDRSSLAYQYRNLTAGTGSWNSIDGTVDYQRTSRKNSERKFTLSYKLTTGPESSDNYIKYSDIQDNLGLDIVKNMLLNNAYSKSKTNTAEHTFQADYTTPLGKMHTLDAGVKYIIRNNSSNNRIFDANGTSEDYVFNNNRSSHYKHINDIMAAYLSYTFKYKFFSFMPGLRYEYTYQNVKYISGAMGSDANFNTHYGDFVPSVKTSFKIGDSQTIRLEYNMRISRPGIWSLNPYFDNTDPANISQGNSHLKSEKSNSFNLNYSYFNPKFNMTAQFSHKFTNNGIESISRLIGESGEWFDGNKHFASAGSLYSTYQNIGKSRNTELNLYCSWNPVTTFQFWMNGEGGYTHLESPAQNLKNYGWQGSLYGGISYTTPFKLRIGLNGGGSTPSYALQGKDSGYYWYSLRLNRSFIKDRLTLSAYASNFLKKYHHYDNTTFGSNFRYNSSYHYGSCYYGMSISYRIGSLKAAVKKAEHTIENNDVKGGGSKSQGGVQGGQGGN